MKFTELTAFIESSFEIDLLELQYYPYTFGSGVVVYRIKGSNVKLVYDGKEDVLSVYKTEKHVKYPTDNWTSIYWG
jgi:hypothetical protein